MLSVHGEWCIGLKWFIDGWQCWYCQSCMMMANDWPNPPNWNPIQNKSITPKRHCGGKDHKNISCLSSASSYILPCVKSKWPKILAVFGHPPTFRRKQPQMNANGKTPAHDLETPAEKKLQKTGWKNKQPKQNQNQFFFYFFLFLFFFCLIFPTVTN